MKNKVPKLRFPEFSGEWEKKKLNELGTVGRGKSKHRPRNDKILFGGNYPFIQTGDIKNAKLFLKEYSQTYSEEGFKQSKLWNKGTLCITIAANIAETCILGINACFPDSIIGINVYQNKGSVIFLKNYFDFLKREFEKLAEGLAQDNLNLEKLLSINFKIPSLSEQEKIANFLSSVDIKIEKLEKKKELLEKYKKGMMQKLFSQKLRFKDENGNDYPEWEEKKLREISDVRDGTHDSPKYIEKGYPFITSKNLMENGQINFKDINYISKEDYISINKRSQVTKGDILFGMIGTIGNPVIVTKEGFAIKNVALIKEQNNLKNNFLLQLLKSSITKKQFHVLNTGGTQKFISLGLIRDLEFNIPSLPEQEKIANFLSSIDRKIELVEEELEKNKEFKKGLLQQMFV